MSDTNEMGNDKSNMPEYDNTRPDRGPIMADDEGSWTYPSAAVEGFVNVEIPLPPGSVRPSEQVLAKDFGHYVSGKLEAAFAPTICDYKVAPVKSRSPAELFSWFTGAAKGSELLSAGAMGRMEKLSEAFAKSSQPEDFYQSNIKPFLASLTPRRR